MARLSIQSTGFQERTIELHLGVNTFGRAEDNDWQISHPTVSSKHCEIEIALSGLKLRDCGSTNGTFVDGIRVQEAELAARQALRMGDIEFLVENADVRIAIPKFETLKPAPPVVLPSGGMICPKHPEAAVTHRCPQCLSVMCEACVHRLRRRGGSVLMLCPFCSHPVEALAGRVRKKKKFLDYLRTTVKMPFMRDGRRDG